MSGRRHLEDLAGQPLTATEVSILTAYARIGDQRQVAADLRLSRSHVRNTLSDAYAKLGAQSNLDAYRRLGWLRVP